MNQVLMQPKMYNLRLNLEQVSLIADGFVENRKNITAESINRYDSQMNDIFDQFASQDVHIDVKDEVEDMDRDYRIALDTISELKRFILSANISLFERKVLENEVTRLEHVLFG